MLHNNGANPMRWDCTTQGCFNLKKRPKVEVFADCLPCVRRQLPVCFSENYVFQQNLSSSVRKETAPMGAAEIAQAIARAWTA